MSDPKLEAVLAQYQQLMHELGGKDGVEGIDKNVLRFENTSSFASVDAVGDPTEADVLRRNNVSLMEALNEERNLRTKTERALVALQDEINLVKLEGEAEIEGYRLASSRLQNQVRSLCEETGMEVVFKLFEGELSRLSKEVAMLRSRNVQLETKGMDIDYSAPIAVDTVAVDMTDGGPINSPPFMGYNSRESKRLLLRLRQKTAEADNLWKECERLRAAERSHAFSLRQTRDSTRRLNLAAQMTQRQKQLVDQEQVEHAKTKSSLAVMQHEANALEEECRSQRKENEALRAEIAMLKAKVVDAQAKARTTAKMANFVAKHKGGRW